MRAVLAALAPMLLVTGCSADKSATPPGEDAALNDAAAALEADSADVNDAEIIDEPEGNVQ